MTRGEGRVEFRVLGPLELLVDGTSVGVPVGRQRALLAALLLARGRVVAADRLVDLVWGEHPGQGRASLQTSISRLRRSLAPLEHVLGEPVVSRPPGYLLVVPEGSLDADAFIAELAEARAAASADPAAALAVLSRATARWRGRAWAEYADGLARADALRLEELLLQAREERGRMLVRLGRVGEAVADLEELVSEQPLREDAVALLAATLADAGRAGDALAVLARHRGALRDELGLDPSPALRQLQQRVLRPPPAVDIGVPTGEATRGGTTAPPVLPPRRPGPPKTLGRTTPLLGRDSDLAAIRRALSTAFLVTLVGPGGVGKTRLAHHLLTSSGDGGAWVDLAPQRDPTGVLPALAHAIGVELLHGTSAQEAVRLRVAESAGLLVLDNCEHLLDAVADVVAEIRPAASARGMRILATSRERLGVEGERVVIVEPLALRGPSGRAEDAPAVRLFLDRARASDPRLQLDETTLRHAEDICTALDGLPLAIELAAARVGSITLGDLAERLDARFELLRGGRRGDDERHRTLRGVVDWSFELLSANEQCAFVALGVFATAFDLDAAEHVLEAAGILPAYQVADVVARLAECSMLMRPGGAGRGRYRMLETLRQYALSRLTPDQEQRLRRAHARWALAVAEAAEMVLLGSEEAAAAAQLAAVIDDLRAAFHWAVDNEHDIAARIPCACLRWAYWRLRADVLAWADHVAGQGAPPELHGHPLAVASYAAAAAVAWLEGHFGDARRWADSGVRAAEGVDHPATLMAWELRADVALLDGDPDAAVAAFGRVAERAAERGDRTTASVALGNTALAHAFAGRLDQARAVAERALCLAEEADNPTARGFALYARGEALADSDPDAALAALEQSRRIADSVGNRLTSGVALTASVALRSRHGDPAAAFALFRQVIEHWRSSRSRSLLTTALRNLVVLLARTGHDRAAVELAVAVDRDPGLHASYGLEQSRVREALAGARARLGPSAYDGAVAAGSVRTVEEAADAALAAVGDPVTP